MFGGLHIEIATMKQSSLVQKMEYFDKKKQSPSFKVTQSYVDSVLTLLFIRASCQGVWSMHLASLEQLCPLFLSSLQDIGINMYRWFQVTLLKYTA